MVSSLIFNNTNNAFFSNVKAYPSSSLHKSNNFKTLGDTSVLPYNMTYNNCKNTLCYTQNKGTFIYKPHNDYGMVGRTSAGYLAQRRRL
jgi:hypothetical protein